MIKLIDILNEIGDASAKKYKWTIDRGSTTPQEYANYIEFSTPQDITTYQFTTDKGTKYTVEMDYGWSDRYEGLIVDVNFWAHDEYGIDSEMSVTNLGEQYEIMATVTDIVISWINEWDKHVPIGKVIIAPKSEEDEDTSFGNTTSKRGKMYALYIKNQLSKLDKPYKYRTFDDQFELYLPDLPA